MPRLLWSRDAFGMDISAREPPFQSQIVIFGKKKSLRIKIAIFAIFAIFRLLAGTCYKFGNVI